ncbi:MAG: hypothetical protein NC830_03490, partial [Candidatus Omnitrophica bacterium]|nr:hypothetical protein [Candidatus Omnitrophota bacterium]
MKITICGSIAFYDEMVNIKKELERLEHIVKMPPSALRNSNEEVISSKEFYKIRKQENIKDEWVWALKESAIREHFKKIEWADAILVLNYEKNNIQGYVGPSTLMEMGLAFYLNKKIY